MKLVLMEEIVKKTLQKLRAHTHIRVYIYMRIIISPVLFEIGKEKNYQSERIVVSHEKLL